MTNYLVLQDLGISYSDFFLHEMGHYFGLLHTHEGYDQPSASARELVTRGSKANCTIAGDLICDTPADPFPLIKNELASSFPNYNCDGYVNTQVRDANNEVFQPNTRIIMSYYNSDFYKLTCSRYFTDGQLSRMAGYGVSQRLASNNAYKLNCSAMNVLAPTNLKAVRSGSQVLLNWNDVASNEAGYFIERANQANDEFTVIGGVGPNQSTFQDATADVNQTYYYRIKPANSTSTISSTALYQNCSLQVGITGKSTICKREVSTLTASVTGGTAPYSYQWTLNGLPFSSGRSTVTTDTTGDYSVVVMDTKGCQAVAPVFGLRSKTGVSITAYTNGPLSFCQGGSVTIGLNPTSPANTQWTVNNNAISTPTNNRLTVNTSGLYRIHVQNECQDTTFSFVINVWPLPQPSITGDLTICSRKNVNLTASVSAGAAPYRYQWKLNNTLLAETNNILSANTAGIYSVMVTDSRSCQSNVSSFTLTAQSRALSIYKSGSLSFCQGGSVGIGVVGATIRWTLNGNPLSGITGKGDTIRVKSAGNYQARLQMSCLDTTISFPITVWELPKPSISGPAFVCPNSSISLKASASGGFGFYSFEWIKNGRVVGTESTKTETDTANYYLKVRDSNGCVNSTNVYSIDRSYLQVEITGSHTLCTGQTSGLIALQNGGKPPYNWQWQYGDSKVGRNSDTLILDKPGNYVVTITDAQGCSVKTDLFTIKEASKVPAFITPSGSVSVYAPKTVLLQANVGPDLQYQWQRNSLPINGATHSSFEVTQSGSYGVMVSRYDGCSSVADPVVVTISPVLATEPNSTQPETSTLLQCTPNPADQSAIIEFGLPKRMSVTLSILAIDSKTLAVLVQGHYSSGWHKFKVELGGLPSGIYLYQLKTDQGIYTKRLIVAH